MKTSYKIRDDSMFKAIFTKNENRDLLERLIYECTNLEAKVISVEATELKKNSPNDKKKILDVLVRTKDEEINIEVNSYESNSLRRRNASYIFKRYADGLYEGENYHDMLKYIQINLTSNLSKKSSLISLYTLKNDKNEEFIDNLEIYEINLQKAKDECYNGSKLSVIGLLEMDLGTLNKIDVKGDKIMEKLKKEAKQYFSTLEPFLPPELEEKLLINTLKEDARLDGLKEGREEGFEQGRVEGIEQGREEGLEQGHEEEKVNIAKKLLEKQTSDELIIEITGITKEQLEKIKNG